MRIDLNARLVTADGHDAGRIRRVLIDPATETVTGFVVGTGGLLGRDVIVGEDAFARAEPSGDTITLSLTKDELSAAPTFEEATYVVPPIGWEAPALGYFVPPSAYLWPAATEPVAGAEAAPAIKKGDTVKDRDGDVVGSVEEIRFDEGTGELSAVIVRIGAGLERLFGSGKTAEISRDDILRIVEGEVRLGVDREEIPLREREAPTG